MFEEFESWRKKDDGKCAMSEFIRLNYGSIADLGELGIDLAWEIYKLREVLHIWQLQDDASIPPKAHKVHYQTKC